MSTTTSLPFEQAIDRLNQLAQEMEKGNLPMETALLHFEEGVQLIRHCQKTLTQAEQRVSVLLQTPGDEPALKPFEAPHDGND